MQFIYRTAALCALGFLSACGTGNSTNSDSSSSVSSTPTSSSSSLSSSSNSSTSSTPETGVSVFTDLPKEMRITEDGEQLQQGGFYSSKLYDESVLETIYLDFAQPDYLAQLSQNYSSKTEIPATLRYKDKVLEQVGVRFRGNTSYSRAGNKKSFAVDLEWAIDGQDINGYNELKLNNGFEDPSAMREVLYSNLIRKNIPAAKANFVQLVVNGANYGIYANVQKLDKDHVKEWFLDKDATRWRAERLSSGGGFGGFGAGTSSLNNLGSNGSSYESAYALKYAVVEDPWQDLANAAYTMGVSSPEYFIEEVSQYLDIDAALWFVASENIFTDDDGYVNKGGMDYYIYFDLYTGRIIPIEYDGNTALSTRLASNWSPFYNIDNSNFPLINILLNIPELRQRYLAHYRTLMEEALNPAIAQAKVDAYTNLIGSGIAANDAVRLYSYSEFQNGVQDLRNFFTTRTQYLQNNAEISNRPAAITAVYDEVAGIQSARPTDQQTVSVVAQIAVGDAVKQVNLYYGTDLMGRFNQVAMNNTGNNRFSAIIPAFAKGTFVRYYVEAIANDSANTASFSPVGAEHDVYIYQVQAAANANSAVVINEIMPANSTIVVDETGAYGDWIELYNTSNTAVDLSGWYLTDEEVNLTRWAFPAGTTIAANGTLIVWADDNEELTSGLHSNFKLSATGESVFLVTPTQQFADKVSYENAMDDWSYARLPNGSGAFSWTSATTFNNSNF